MPPDGLGPVLVPVSPVTLGRYRIICELARGGMSVVHLGLMQGPARFHKLLVLKELKPSLTQDPKLVSMFLAEARLAARLSHPHVVQTLEVGSDGARHYIVMEYLDGRPLSHLIARARSVGAPLPLHAHLGIIAAALDGLAYAHGATGYDGRPLGLVHRDVSPQNVFVTCDGQVKILDFGIAKAADMANDTGIGVLKGKIAYMAPEQAAGKTIDARVDVFAAGVMLLEAATDRRVWAGAGNDWYIVQSLVNGELPTRDPAALGGVDAELRWIIQTCLAPDPADRYKNAGALLDDLRPVLRKLTPPSFGIREIGHRVRELFAPDRARMQAAIEAQIAHASETLESGDDFAALSGATPASLGPVSSPLSSVKTTLSSTISLTNPSGTRIASAAVGGLAAVTLLAAAFIGGPRAATTGHADTVAAATVLPAPPLVAAPPVVRASAPPPVVAGPVIVELHATPAWAHIRLDGKPVPNPFIGRMPRDGTSHTVEVEAPGYVPLADAFLANDDVAKTIALRGRPRPVTGGAPVPESGRPVPGATPVSTPDPVANAPARPIDVSNPYAR